MIYLVIVFALDNSEEYSSGVCSVALLLESVWYFLHDWTGVVSLKGEITETKGHLHHSTLGASCPRDP